METINIILIALGTSVASSFGTFIFTKRKYRAEAVGAEIANYRSIIKDWQDAAEEWKKQAGEYRKLYIESTSEIDKLKLEIRKLRKEVDILKADKKQ